MTSLAHFEDFCEDKARTGDGLFAVAYALLQLKRVHERAISALQGIGTGTVDSQGGLEMVAAELKGLSENVDAVGASIATAIAERE